MFRYVNLVSGIRAYLLSGGIKSKSYREKKKAEVKERERARKTFSDVARKTCSHTRTQWRKSLTWMIAADQLVGREVSFSKSGFQFPKGAYTAYTDGIAFSSEFASGVTDRHRDLLENETRPRNTGEFFVLPILFIFSSRSLLWMTRRWFDAARKFKNRVYSSLLNPL